MRVHHYETASGKDLIRDYLNSVSKAEKTDGSVVLEKLEEEKYDELNIKPWRGKISEVYFYKHNRFFYIVADRDNMYVLHACRKQKNKTEKKDSDIIIKRAKELGDMLSKKFV